jgi:hypothetical protein
MLSEAWDTSKNGWTCKCSREARLEIIVDTASLFTEKNTTQDLCDHLWLADLAEDQG